MILRKLSGVTSLLEVKSIVEIFCAELGTEFMQVQGQYSCVNSKGAEAALSRAVYQKLRGYPLSLINHVLMQEAKDKFDLNANKSDFKNQFKYFLTTNTFKSLVFKTASATSTGEKEETYSALQEHIWSQYDTIAERIFHGHNIWGIYAQIPSLRAGLLNRFLATTRKSKKVTAATLEQNQQIIIQLQEDFSTHSDAQINLDTLDDDALNIENLLGASIRNFLSAWIQKVLPEILPSTQTVSVAGGDILELSDVQTTAIEEETNIDIRPILENINIVNFGMFEYNGTLSANNGLKLQTTVLEWYLQRQYASSISRLNTAYTRIALGNVQRAQNNFDSTISASGKFVFSTYYSAQRTKKNSDFMQKISNHKRYLEEVFDNYGNLTNENFIEKSTDFVDRVNEIVRATGQKSSSITDVYIKEGVDFVSPSIVPEFANVIKAKYAFTDTGMRKLRALFGLPNAISELRKALRPYNLDIIDLPGPKFFSSQHQKVATSVEGILHETLFQADSKLYELMDDGSHATTMMMSDNEYVDRVQLLYDRMRDQAHPTELNETVLQRSLYPDSHISLPDGEAAATVETGLIKASNIGMLTEIHKSEIFSAKARFNTLMQTKKYGMLDPNFKVKEDKSVMAIFIHLRLVAVSLILPGVSYDKNYSETDYAVEDGLTLQAYKIAFDFESQVTPKLLHCLVGLLTCFIFIEDEHTPAKFISSLNLTCKQFCEKISAYGVGCSKGYTGNCNQRFCSLECDRGALLKKIKNLLRRLGNNSLQFAGIVSELDEIGIAVIKALEITNFSLADMLCRELAGTFQFEVPMLLRSKTDSMSIQEYREYTRNRVVKINSLLKEAKAVSNKKALAAYSLQFDMEHGNTAVTAKAVSISDLIFCILQYVHKGVSSSFDTLGIPAEKLVSYYQISDIVYSENAILEYTMSFENKFKKLVINPINLYTQRDKISFSAPGVGKRVTFNDFLQIYCTNCATDCQMLFHDYKMLYDMLIAPQDTQLEHMVSKANSIRLKLYLNEKDVEFSNGSCVGQTNMLYYCKLLQVYFNLQLGTVLSNLLQKFEIMRANLYSLTGLTPATNSDVKAFNSWVELFQDTITTLLRKPLVVIKLITPLNLSNTDFKIKFVDCHPDSNGFLRRPNGRYCGMTTQLQVSSADKPEDILKLVHKSGYVLMVSTNPERFSLDPYENGTNYD